MHVNKLDNNFHFLNVLSRCLDNKICKKKVCCKERNLFKCPMKCPITTF